MVSTENTLALIFGLVATIGILATLLAMYFWRPRIQRNWNSLTSLFVQLIQRERAFENPLISSKVPDQELALLNSPLPSPHNEADPNLLPHQNPDPHPLDDGQIHQAIGDALDAFARLVRLRAHTGL